ncbi:MAG: hypothetical protein AAB368_13970, partial [bacterium]
ILAAIAGIIWIAAAPLRIWHTIGADGQEHPDAATWAAYGAGGAVITLAGGCLLTWTVYLLAARGVTDPDAPVLLVLRPAWAPRLLGLSDWVMAALLLWLVAGLKWHTFVLPALDALSGAGGPIFDSSR